MSIHYYLSIFPIEALIASELDPEAFGVYMATASHRGSAEPHAFIESEGKLGCILRCRLCRAKMCSGWKGTHKKSSVYLSIYRCLEKIPLSSMGTLFTGNDSRWSFAAVGARAFGTSYATELSHFIFIKRCRRYVR